MAKELLVTSDDFGMCHSVNLGIVRAMTEGIVRSTNFMVPCPWFTEALELARTHGLRVGVHLCLTCDWDRLRWGPLTYAPSLVDAQGYFLPTWEALGEQASDAEMHAEYTAQIRRLLGLGYRPTHFDSHMMGATSDAPIHRCAKAIIRQLCDEYALPYTYDRTTQGLVHFQGEIEVSGRGLEDVFRVLEGWTSPGLYHLIGHAAVPSDELASMCSVDHPARPWAEQYRARDLDFFTSSRVRARIEDLGFEIVDITALSSLAAGPA
jgi:hypothetical protein